MGNREAIKRWEREGVKGKRSVNIRKYMDGVHTIFLVHTIILIMKRMDCECGKHIILALGS